MIQTLEFITKKYDHIGKWHVDDPNDLTTWAYHRGFDYAVQEQWGSRFGGIDYDPYMHWINGKQDSIYYNWTEWECKDEFLLYYLKADIGQQESLAKSEPEKLQEMIETYQKITGREF